VLHFFDTKIFCTKMCNATPFQSLIDNGLQMWECCIFLRNYVIFQKNATEIILTSGIKWDLA